MGTRNLTAVMKDQEYKIAQYGQWDGYPSGQGVTALLFLQGEGNISALNNALERVRFFDAEGIDKDFITAYENNAPSWSNEPDNRTKEQKYWFGKFISRDIGAEILGNVVLSEGEVLLKNSIDFAGDSLMCEYAYIIDLDKNVFEIYEGFNKEEVVEGRFTSNDPVFKTEGKYEPITLLKTYCLDSLPDQEQFLKDLESQED